MLAGRTIVVTGARAASGARSRRPARGASARWCSATSWPKLAARWRGARQDDRTRFVAVDLNDRGRSTAFARDVARHEGEIHGLVNNAAIATNVGGKPFDEIDLDLWDSVMRVNVRGTWLVTRALAPLFADGKHGRIVNVASDTALWAPRLLAYVASKGAVIAMTRSLPASLDRAGSASPWWRPASCAARRPNTCRPSATACTRPDARCRAAGPEDIVDTVVFLLTPALALTGQVLPVNAGFVFT